jgi:ATP-binding cassette subfamily F protein 3
MDSIDALSSALRAFKGGILIVSHDQNFLDSVCSEVWVCNNKKLTRFTGDPNDAARGVVQQYKISLGIE